LRVLVAFEEKACGRRWGGDRPLFGRVELGQRFVIFQSSSAQVHFCFSSLSQSLSSGPHMLLALRTQKSAATRASRGKNSGSCCSSSSGIGSTTTRGRGKKSRGKERGTIDGDDGRRTTPDHPVFAVIFGVSLAVIATGEGLGRRLLACAGRALGSRGGEAEV